jgi:hypothetical protein
MLHPSGGVSLRKRLGIRALMFSHEARRRRRTLVVPGRDREPGWQRSVRRAVGVEVQLAADACSLRAGYIEHPEQTPRASGDPAAWP